MSNEAVSQVVIEPATHIYIYETIETLAPLVTTIEQTFEMGIERVALVTMRLHFDHEGKEASRAQAEQSAAYLLDHLRRKVRKTDSVFLLGYTYYFLLLGSYIEGGQIVQTRLWDELLWHLHESAEGEILHPHGMEIGHSAYPVPCADIGKCIEAASEAKLNFTVIPEKPQRKAGTRVRQTRVPQFQTKCLDGDEELPVLARKLGIPYLSLLPRKSTEQIQQLVNPKLAQELHCYPLGREHNTLTVAMVDPGDHATLDRLQRETGLRIFLVLTHPQELQMALEQLI